MNCKIRIACNYINATVDPSLEGRLFDISMKKILILLFASIAIEKTFGQTLIPKIDERTEIMSIVFRLAGNPEYNYDDAAKYVTDIHSHFDQFKSDSLISFAKFLREKDGVSYDAVMSMAVNLQPREKSFTLTKGWVQSLDKRWTHESASHFVYLLNAFYIKSDAEQFFVEEKPYHNKILNAFNEVLSRLNQSWYYKFYGVKPKEKFNVIIDCSNGRENYGASTNSPKEGKQIYAIMGNWSFDKEGNPIFKEDDYLPVLIHEFNHSFINPLLDKYKSNKTLKTSATKLLDTMKTEMTNQAYKDWETLVNESLVRASVVRYLMVNDSTNQKAKQEVVSQINTGFLWMKDLVTLLGVYENNRAEYKTLNDFYPQIIKFFQSTADKIATIKADYENELPKVVSIEPFENNSQNVDTSIKVMTINFNQPMNEKHHSFNYGQPGKDGFPISDIIGYTNNNKSFKIKMDLKPDTEYEMIITGYNFKNLGGYPLKSYTVKFKTKK